MWDKKKPGTLQAAAPDATGWLGSSLHVKGDITGTEDLLIDGSVEGLIQLDERKLTVGATAKLTADINARDVVVYGSVKGNVRATGRIEIKKDGSIMICAVVKFPMIEPSFLISIRPVARTLPFTEPYTTTSRALMSAVSFAVAPTVNLRSSSWMSPSTEPSISRSSVPVMSPFTCRLDPSHPVASGAAACSVSGFFLSHIGPS